MEVVAAAAPTIPFLAKPPLPYGVHPRELAQGALHELFEVGPSSSSGSGGASGSGSEEEEEEEEQGQGGAEAAQ